MPIPKQGKQLPEKSLEQQAIPHLQPEQAIEVIKQHQGIIPIDILSTETGSFNLLWLNVGDYPLTEWKFGYSIQNLMTNQRENQSFTTPLSLLTFKPFLEDYLYPSGFIFHMSRCGSTILAKALARSPQNIVIIEGDTLNENLWSYLTNNWREPVALSDDKVLIFKHLILAMGKRRVTDHQGYFIKFRSWNVLFLDFIMQVFPDVPSLFLYRDPIEVLVSSKRRVNQGMQVFKGTAAGAYMTGQTAQQTAKISNLSYYTKFYINYIKTALESPTEKLVHLNYNDLTKANFSSILKNAFNYTPAAEQLSLMEEQFDYHSRDDSNRTRFVSDRTEKQQAATAEIQTLAEGELMSLYSQLEESERNLAKLAWNHSKGEPKNELGSSPTG